ncbi:EamA family transporter [Protaetiibacter sp. SSC-01]|uniref:EamA family transporter n=1 Tax=Protaetiibacter sp. SSC-01 TaxID=2759943 RepID=UPI001656D30D|nr:EamA family transporter [Protaetiibacter sp. SSC-01]QNO37738.1 EamA family transporter [Protaetiibacter sp. SSC-01]
MSARTDAGRRRTVVGAATQVGTEVSINLGSALAGVAIPFVGSPIVVAARQLVMIAVLLPFYRPRRSLLTWRRLWPAVALGVALAVMNLTFYESVHLLGLGIAATIEFLGPLLLALATSRRLLDVICVVVAGAGVVLLTGLEGEVDAWGVVLALLAAAAWAAYILLTRRVALGLPGLEGLTVAGIVSLALILPVAAFTLPGAEFSWPVVGLLVGIGILSSALPYALDTFILRRITARLYAIITSFGPVVAAVFGWIVLHERLGWVQLLAIVLVCAAAGTAIATQRPAPASELEQTAEGLT